MSESSGELCEVSVLTWCVVSGVLGLPAHVCPSVVCGSTGSDLFLWSSLPPTDRSCEVYEVHVCDVALSVIAELVGEVSEGSVCECDLVSGFVSSVVPSFVYLVISESTWVVVCAVLELVGSIDVSAVTSVLTYDCACVIVTESSVVCILLVDAVCRYGLAVGASDCMLCFDDHASCVVSDVSGVVVKADFVVSLASVCRVIGIELVESCGTVADVSVVVSNVSDELSLVLVWDVVKFAVSDVPVLTSLCLIDDLIPCNVVCVAWTIECDGLCVVTSSVDVVSVNLYLVLKAASSGESES